MLLQLGIIWGRFTYHCIALRSHMCSFKHLQKHTYTLVLDASVVECTVCSRSGIVGTYHVMLAPFQDGRLTITLSPAVRHDSVQPSLRTFFAMLLVRFLNTNLLVTLPNHVLSTTIAICQQLPVSMLQETACIAGFAADGRPKNGPRWIPPRS